MIKKRPLTVRVTLPILEKSTRKESPCEIDLHPSPIEWTLLSFPRLLERAQLEHLKAL